MAPRQLSLDDLGRPCDSHFHVVSGQQGSAVYRVKTQPDTQVQQIKAEFVEFQNSLALDAGFSGWGVEADAGSETDRRYLAYRMYEITERRVVDDAGIGPLREVPPSVSCYVGAIYLGHSMEVVMSGDSRTFHAGIKARFLTQVFGDLRTAATESGLRVDVQGRGLKPVGPELAMLKSSDDVSRYYRRSDKPVPILVEYRSFPATPFEVGNAIAFAAPPPSFYRYTVQLQSAQIEPGRCSGDCDLVVEITPPSDNAKARIIASPESTNAPSFGGETIVADADVAALRTGFKVRVGDRRFFGSVDNVGTCQLLLDEEVLTDLATEKDRTGEYDLPCGDGVSLSLRILMNEPSDDPGIPTDISNESRPAE
jgi:hypothetical protein